MQEVLNVKTLERRERGPEHEDFAMLATQKAPPPQTEADGFELQAQEELSGLLQEQALSNVRRAQWDGRASRGM